MRIVIGRAGAHVEDFHAKLYAQLSELKGLGQIVFDWMVLVHAETVAIRQAIAKIFRDARTELARLRQCGVRVERNKIKGAQPHRNLDFVTAAANTANDVA